MATTQTSSRSSERVEPEEYSQQVASKLGAAAGNVRVEHGQVWIDVSKERLVDVMSILKTDPDLRCNYFTFLSAVDWQEEGTELIITVFSISFENTVVVSVKLPKGDVVVPSITSVFGGADWHEREAAEMFGLSFEGHPNLVKLYLPEDFEGHPLRKDFKLASRTYKPWPGAKDPDEAAAGGR